MSTTQETTMITDELLKDAAIDGKLSVYNVDHAKHFAVLMLNRDEPEFPHTGKTARFCTVHAETVLMYELEARAELIARAVNSFAAMREALEMALHMENDRRSGIEFSDDDYGNLHDRLTRALALANNTEH